jgi:hypothetical protein
MRTVIGTAEAKGMTVGELRAYVAKLDDAGCPDDAHPAVRVTITGRIHSLTAKFDMPEVAPAKPATLTFDRDDVFGEDRP